MQSPETNLKNQFRRYYQRITPLFKKSKTKTTTSVVFSFLAISLFVFYAIRPTAQTIIYLRREIADKTELNRQMENKITALIEVQSAYESIKERLPVMNQALPENPDATIFARQLSNLAQISGASISALQIQSLQLLTSEATPGAKQAAKKPVQEFPVSIVLTGSYQSLKSFIDGLPSMRRILNIDQLSIRQTISREQLGATLQLSVRLKSYYAIP